MPAIPRAHSVRLLGSTRTALGESPVWDAERNQVWFIDIEGLTLKRLDWASGRETSWPMPDKTGSLALCKSGRLLIAMRDSLYLFSPETAALELFVKVEEGLPDNRLNDGKVAPDGAFWVGSMNDTQARPPTGILYRVTAKGLVEKKGGGIMVSNGLAWSPDGKTMYHSDSFGMWIKRYRHTPGTGALSDETLIARPDATVGRPDGAATDVDGNYWSAGVSAGCLNVWSPEGSLLERIDVPVPNPTMPCFLGADLKTLVVTSLTRTPHANQGMLVTLRSEIAGVPVPRFPL
jgi:sugar lactone lactonase YvrE